MRWLREKDEIERERIERKWVDVIVEVFEGPRVQQVEKWETNSPVFNTEALPLQNSRNAVTVLIA